MCNFWDSQKILNLNLNFFLFIFSSLNCENFFPFNIPKKKKSEF